MIKLRSVLTSGSLKPGIWGKAEDDLLTALVQERLPWKEISRYINNAFYGELNVRNPKHCADRWNNHLNPFIKKGQWTYQEDSFLIECYRLHGNKWDTIACMFGNRTGSSVKNRFNSLLKREKVRKEDIVALFENRAKSGIYPLSN